MRSVVLCGCLLIGLTVGCSAQVSGRADTSAESAPTSVDLSPAALLGKPGHPAGSESAPTAAAIAPGEPGGAAAAEGAPK